MLYIMLKQQMEELDKMCFIDRKTLKGLFLFF